MARFIAGESFASGIETDAKKTSNEERWRARVGRMIRHPKNQIRRMCARDNHGADVSYRDLRETVRILHAVAVTYVNAWTS
jgi:hypothetical protein